MINLRKAIADELKTVLKDFRLKKPKSKKANDYELSPITIFEQNLPPARFGQDDIYAPVVIVQTKNLTMDDESKTVSVTLIIQTWDDQDPQKGEDDVINVITRITDHFSINQRLNKKYWCQSSMSAAVDDEQNPYFDGNILMTWEIPTVTPIMEYEF